MTIKETVQQFVAGLVGNPSALAEVRDALASLPPPPPAPRAVMSDDERKALGAELAARGAAFARRKSELDKQTEEAQRQMREAQERMTEFGVEVSSAAGSYTGWRDAVLARLWAERSPLVDALISRCVEEAASDLGLFRTTKPPNMVPYARPRDFAGAIMDAQGEAEASAASSVRVTTNAPSVQARRIALHALAEELREWTRKGLFATDSELQAAFDEAYAKLPALQVITGLAAA